LNQNVGFWWAFSAVAAIEGIKKSGKYVGNKKILLPTDLLTEQMRKKNYPLHSIGISLKKYHR
jgi:hypothetical protein